MSRSLLFVFAIVLSASEFAEKSDRSVSPFRSIRLFARGERGENGRRKNRRTNINQNRLTESEIDCAVISGRLFRSMCVPKINHYRFINANFEMREEEKCETRRNTQRNDARYFAAHRAENKNLSVLLFRPPSLRRLIFVVCAANSESNYLICAVDTRAAYTCIGRLSRQLGGFLLASQRHFNSVLRPASRKFIHCKRRDEEEAAAASAAEQGEWVKRRKNVSRIETSAAEEEAYPSVIFIADDLITFS